jgi:RHS repeat-associated protein
VEQHGDAPTGTGCSAAPSNDATSPWRVRRFTYDSLGRLLTAKNPESGTICYGVWSGSNCNNGYDADGNLLKKTSPKANQPATGTDTTTISYCYDALHRMLAKGYSNSPDQPQQCLTSPPWLTNPAATFTYDQGTNGVGRMTGLTDQAGTGTYTYDLMGRIATEQRTIGGLSNSVSYDYNLDGSLWKLHYPSGAVVTYTLSANGTNTAGRVLSVADSSNNNYVTAATYGPDGAITAFVNGGTITNRFTYNNRLQPCRITAGTANLPLNCADSSVAGNVFDIAYDFHFQNNNNGNVYGITNYRDRSRDQTFTYDVLNRLASAKNAGTDCTKKALNLNQTEYWGNNYTYDGWGNLIGKSLITSPQSVCGGEGLSVNADVTNRLQNGYGYDPAGNMTYDPTPGHQLTYTYDQENRITGAGGYAYTYDADGNRVKKSNGSAGTLYWYMAPGIVAESDLNGNTQSEYVFFNGERVARRDGVNGSGGIFCYFSDRLKTASVITNSAGTIKAESDYYPWGGELQLANADSNHYKFTGKERDGETQLDYFGARYYSNGMGRWMTPDWAVRPTPVPYAGFGNPQSLNLYSYVKNSPTTFTDPNGHCVVDKEKHGWLWCAAHAIGLAETKKEHEAMLHQAADSMRRLWKEQGQMLYYNGKPVHPDRLSDAQVLEAAQVYWQAYWSDYGDEGDSISPAIAGAIANISTQIANGHAWTKHQGEFPGWDKDKFRDAIENTMAQPDDVKYLSNGRTAYWNAKEKMVVIENPADPDGGTAFRPSNDKLYFDSLK